MKTVWSLYYFDEKAQLPTMHVIDDELRAFGEARLAIHRGDTDMVTITTEHWSQDEVGKWSVQEGESRTLHRA